ncbi:MAG: PAS domain S-box protein, partial [Gallionella sp.]
MKPHFRKTAPTLRQIFSRRLFLLLGLFSVVMSTFIVVAYQHQTDRLNRSVLSGNLSHLMPRIEDQQRIWNDDADHLLDVIEWSGLLNLPEPVRTAKLQAFFTAQTESIGFEGVAITDSTSGKLLFDFWNNSEKPEFQQALIEDQPLWYDDQHVILYTKVKKSSPAYGHTLQTFFFKAWDSAMLRRLNFPDTTTFISLGAQPLLSSAGNLALASSQPYTGEYAERTLNGIKYQEGSVSLTDVLIADGHRLPLTMSVRSPIKNALPISLVLAASVGITILFGVLLFVVFGLWLRRLGTRLDELANAALHFKNDQASEITNETRRLLQLADAQQKDQISVVAYELSSLMASSAERDAEQRAYLQTLDLLQDAVIEVTPEGKLLRATDAWKTLTGKDDLAFSGIVECVHPEDAHELLEQLSALTHEQKNQISIRFRLLRPNDASKHYWVEGRFAVVKHNEMIVSIRGVVRDITNTYRQERQISHMALHDALTDLPNRVLLEDRLEMSISR